MFLHSFCTEKRNSEMFFYNYLRECCYQKLQCLCVLSEFVCTPEVHVASIHHQSVLVCSLVVVATLFTYYGCTKFVSRWGNSNVCFFASRLVFVVPQVFFTSIHLLYTYIPNYIPVCMYVKLFLPGRNRFSTAVCSKYSQ